MVVFRVAYRGQCDFLSKEVEFVVLLNSSVYVDGLALTCYHIVCLVAGIAECFR